MISPNNFSSIGRLTWLRILLGGVLLFIFIERSYSATENINYLPSLLLIGAFTAPLAFTSYFYSRRKAPTISLYTLLVCALWGGVIGSVIAGRLEYDAVKRFNTLPTLGIGVIEELAKLVVPAYILFRNKRSSVSDGIMVGVAVGAGFAALESMGYGLAALVTSNGNVNATVDTLLYRGLSSPAAHIAWTGLLSGALWKAFRTHAGHRYRDLIFTFATVVILHALWDTVTSLLALIAIGVASLTLLFIRVHTTEKSASNNSPTLPRH